MLLDNVQGTGAAQLEDLRMPIVDVENTPFAVVVVVVEEWRKTTRKEECPAVMERMVDQSVCEHFIVLFCTKTIFHQA